MEFILFLSHLILLLMAIFQFHAYNLERLNNVLLVLFIGLSHDTHTELFTKRSTYFKKLAWLGHFSLPSPSRPETPTH